MIPLLPLAPTADKRIEEFCRELSMQGFTGDFSRSESDKTVFSTDNSIYQLSPAAICFPRSSADVALAMRSASQPRFQSITVTPRGGGTGTNGQSLTQGVVLDVSRHMNRILEINLDEGWARVEAGVVKDQLDASLAPHGMFFAPELSTSNRATIGGMINTDASGQGSCIYGKTRDHVLELTTVLTDGTVWNSSPLSESALRTLRARSDLVGRIHKTMDDLEAHNRQQIQAKFPKLNRCLTGYDLAHIRTPRGEFDLNSLLCGSEGTLGVVVEAKLRILPLPKQRAIVVIRYDDFIASLRHAPRLIGLGAASIETIDSTVLSLAQEDVCWIDVAEFFPVTAGDNVRAVNLVELLGETPDEIERALTTVCAELTADRYVNAPTGYTIARGEQAVERIWSMRKRAVGLLGKIAGERRPVAFVEDTVVPPERLADYIEEFRALLDRHGLAYGMFGHVDAGVLHVRPALDLKDPEQEQLVRLISDSVVDLTLKYGGLLWGEHGKGVRGEYGPLFFGDLYPLLEQVKTCFDPAQQLNPGKIVAAKNAALMRIDTLPTRGQADRTIPQADRVEYAQALQCNGNGVCFDWEPQSVMCPSWKATRERRHSPKGRAMLVREWLRRLKLEGVGVVDERRRLRSQRGIVSLPGRAMNTLLRTRRKRDFSDEVKEAFDGCLACKGCVTGCPIQVNIPRLRSKFLEIYYGRYLRPAADYLLGSLEASLPMLSRMPRVVNSALTWRFSRKVLAVCGVVDSPMLSVVNLKAVARSRGHGIADPNTLDALAPDEKAKCVVVVQDAFTTYYDTEVLLATLDLIEKLGYRPLLAPYAPNGKPLHVLGRLNAFVAAARRNAHALRELSIRGVPLVGIDPSMTLTYRSEYTEAIGVDAPKVLLLQEWLDTASPKGLGRAIVEYMLFPHCSEQAMLQSAAKTWERVFDRFGLKLVTADVGCCGMAGNYGHLAVNRDMSQRVFDLSWQPNLEGARAIRSALVTGYSCRCQIKRFAGAPVQHPVQALLLKLKDDELLLAAS